MISVHPPVPVGYIDGSLDTEGLEDDESSEYIIHSELARQKSRLRKKVHVSNRRSEGKTTNILTDSSEKGNTDGDCEGIACCKTGNSLRLEKLIESGWEVSTVDKHGSNGMHWAAGAGHLNILETLIKHGLSINSANRFHFLIVASSTSCRSVYLVSLRRTGRNALHWASRNGMVETCRWLASHGADLHSTTKARAFPTASSPRRRWPAAS